MYSLNFSRFFSDFYSKQLKQKARIDVIKTHLFTKSYGSLL